MDDGFLRKDGVVAIATDKFSEEALREIIFGLRERYDICPTVTKRRRLYFGVEATRKLVRIISPHIISAMRYKLP